MQAETASIYIHIPFCASFCDYCDFYSVLAEENAEIIDAYLIALIRDLKNQIEYFEVKEIPTVYIGGGTPSVLGKKISLLFDELNKMPFSFPKEFTIEANPESITEDFLCACKNGGVNRLSAGVQTFLQSSRNAVNRGYDTQEIEKKLNLIKKYFPDEFCADLMIGLPYQNEKTVSEDINKILEYAPSHISLYSLTVERNTPLERKIKTKTVNLPDSETADSLWLLARDKLLSECFNHYEVSNFAKEDSQCRHNLRYWNMQNWIGAGPAASGTIINEKTSSAARFTYPNDINAYIKSPNLETAVFEQLDKNMLIRESLLMGYRLKNGPDPEIFKRRFGCPAEDCIPKTTEKWKGKDKLLFLNKFILDAFYELEEN